MRKLPLPVEMPSDVFRICIRKIKSPVLRKRLGAIEPEIITAANSYVAKASAAQLHTLNPQDSVGSVSRDEMCKVYTQRMAKKGAPGRPIYDRILLAPPHGTCPLCGIRKVSTIDHHLPKTRYPALAVVPANLVPACADCNKGKGDVIPGKESQQTIHPYFDNFDSETWLFAEVIEATPPGIRYFVRPPSGWSKLWGRRVENHFRLFGLATLYASNAGEELENIRHRMTIILKSVGSQGVQSELMHWAESFAATHANSWKTAMYKALADSDWYCKGGFI